MVRGNYQRRIEKTEARRMEAKQRKQRTEAKRLYKTQVQELLGFLDQNSNAIMTSENHNWVIHVWVDSQPSDAPPMLDLTSDGEMTSSAASANNSHRKGRGRSNSVNSETTTPSKGKKKKAHPRSKEATIAAEPEEDSAGMMVPRLCRSLFFTGKCSSTSTSGKKGGACHHVHYPKRYMTLKNVLSGKDDAAAKERLNLCADAYPLIDSDSSGDTTRISSPGSSNGDAMEMLFYISIPLNDDIHKDDSNDDSESSKQSLSQRIVDALSSRDCSIASVVYLTIQDKLLFDRYRQGLLIPSSESSNNNSLAAFLKGSATMMIRRGSSDAQDDGNTTEDHFASFVWLPGNILDHVLTFLPDTAVAAASAVCRTWNQEIRVSGFLWKHLLERRNWPLPELEVTRTDNPDITDDNNNFKSMEERQRLLCREAFVSHYMVLRDLRALRNGLDGLLLRKPVQEKECCLRSFAANTRTAPQHPNSCVDVKFWSENRMLVAYSHDCSLRLFSSTTSSRGENNSVLLCKELVTQYVDPYRTTKKKRCRIVALDLDDTVVACLCHVMEEYSPRNGGEAFVLSVMNREDFLVGGEDSLQDEGLLHVIDIGQAVLNYLLSYQGNDQDQFRLMDFLEVGAIEDVEIIASQSIVACGQGRFMVEVSISIPNDDGMNDDDSDSIEMTMLFRKMFLFSASHGSVVWMGDSNYAGHDARPRNQDMTLRSRFTQPDTSSSREQCDVIALSSVTNPIMTVTMDPRSGVVGTSEPLRTPPGANNSTNDQAVRMIIPEHTVEEGWRLKTLPHLPVTFAEGDDTIIVGHSVMKLEEREVNPNGGDHLRRSLGYTYKSFLSFHSFSGNGGTSTMLPLQGNNLQLESIVTLRNRHVVALCRDEHYDAVAEGEALQRRESVMALLIDIAAKCVIHQQCLIDNLGEQLGANPYNFSDLPIRLASGGNTVCLAVAWKGVVLTGSDVRESDSAAGVVGGESPSKAGTSAALKKKKAKKNQKMKKQNKKDGFARGMSLRG